MKGKFAKNMMSKMAAMQEAENKRREEEELRIQYEEQKRKLEM